MKKLFTICFLLLVSITQHVFAQTSFIGFDQEQCGLIENPGYTFENVVCANHGYGYRIFLKGELIYQTCEQYYSRGVVKLIFINDSTGFLIEGNSNGHTVYKTINFGKTWKSMSGGTPTYWGFYLLNEHNGYLLTATNGYGPIITRVSDIDSKQTYEFDYHYIDNEVIINDTILGSSFCNFDTLSFNIKKGPDTINYVIRLKNEPLTAVSQIKSGTMLELYPNPADDFIRLVSERSGRSHIRILNSSGLTIKEFDDSNFNRLYVGDLKKGLYLIELNSGKNMQIGKFVKK